MTDKAGLKLVELPRNPTAAEVVEQFSSEAATALKNVVVVYTTHDDAHAVLLSNMLSPAEILLFLEKAKLNFLMHMNQADGKHAS